MPQTPALQTENLVKHFGVAPVLRGLNLAVNPGEVVALVGPNGAGKTTFLRICATLSRPSSGAVRVFGVDAVEESDRIRAKLTYLAHNPGLYDELTGAENLRLMAGLFRTPDAERRLTSELERFGLAARAASAVKTFSRGMKQRLALARVFMLHPPLILLDEPFTGLDAAGVDVLLNALRDYHAGGGTVVMTTHRPADEVPPGGRIAQLERGLVADS